MIGISIQRRSVAASGPVKKSHARLPWATPFAAAWHLAGSLPWPARPGTVHLTDNFFDPSAWDPSGAPPPGNAPVIAAGNPVVTDATLAGYQITLGGTGELPGPAYATTDFFNSSPGVNTWELETISPPDPTLTLKGATIAASTTIHVPATPLIRLFGFFLPPEYATIEITGGTGGFDGPGAAGISTNHGTTNVTWQSDFIPRVPFPRLG